MIVREIKNNPLEVIAKFDFFNDTNDTMFWLSGVIVFEKDNNKKQYYQRILEMLDTAYLIWLQKYQDDRGFERSPLKEITRVHKLGERTMKFMGVDRQEQQGWIIEKMVDNKWVYVTCCHPNEAGRIQTKISKGEY
jgi:hypothetical protein